MIKNQGKIFRASIAGLCVMALIGLGLFVSDKSTAKVSNQPTILSAAAMLTQQMSNSEKQKIFEEWTVSSSDCYRSAKDASSKGLPFALKVPRETVAKVQNIYVDRAGNPQDRRALVLFEGGIFGIQMTAVKESEQPDFKAIVKAQLADMKAGILFNDKAPQVMDLDGSLAWTTEPGFNVVGEQKMPRPGVVEWWDSGVLYNLYGTSGPKGTTVNELLDIARSVKADDIDPNDHASAETLQALTPKPSGVMSDHPDIKQGTVEFEK